MPTSTSKTFNLTSVLNAYNTANDPLATAFTIAETGAGVFASEVTIASNAKTAAITLKDTGDTINLYGSFSDYTVKFSGTTATFTSATQTISVVMSSLANGYGINNTIAFDDGTFSLTKPQNSSTVYLSNQDDDGYQLARQKIGTTAAAINSIVLTAEVAGGVEGGTPEDHQTADEGTEVIYHIYTNGVAAGTVYTYTLSGVNANDLVGGSTTGSVTIDENGNGLLAFSLNEDFTSENTEFMKLAVAGQAVTVDILDTSSNLPVALQANKTDVIVGTGFDDLILGEISPGSSQAYSWTFGDNIGYGYTAGYDWQTQTQEFRTLNNSDIIYGRGGDDELRLSVTASGLAQAQINMQEVETLSIHATSNYVSNFGPYSPDYFLGAGVLMDLTNVTGLENVDVYGVENIEDLVLINMKEMVNVSLHGNGSYSGTDVNLEYDPEVVSGSNDTQTIDLDRFDGNLHAIQGIESFNITSNYDSQPGEFHGQDRNNNLNMYLGEDTTTSLTISSEQNLDLNVYGGFDLKSIDASESTGNLNIELYDDNNNNNTNSLAAFESYYGGSGNDTLRLHATRADDNTVHLNETQSDSNEEDLHIELGRGDNNLYAIGGLDDVFIKAGGGSHGGEDTPLGTSNASDNNITLDANKENVWVDDDNCGNDGHWEVRNHSVGDVTIDLKYAIGTQNITINKAIYDNGVGNDLVRVDDTSNDLIVMTGGQGSTTNIDITGTTFDNSYMLGNYENLQIYSDETLSEINLNTGHGDQNINVQSNGDVNITVGDGNNFIKVDGFTSWTHIDGSLPTPQTGSFFGEDHTVFGANDHTFANTVTVNVGHGDIANIYSPLDYPYEENNAVLGLGENQFIIHANDDITINVRDYRTDDVNINNLYDEYASNNDGTYVDSVLDINYDGNYNGYDIDVSGLDINLSFVASENGSVTVNAGEISSGTTELFNREFDDCNDNVNNYWIFNANADIRHLIEVDTNIHADAVSFTNISNAGDSTNVNMGDIYAGAIDIGRVGEDDVFIDVNTNINVNTNIHDLTAVNGSDINIHTGSVNFGEINIQDVNNNSNGNDLNVNINVDINHSVSIHDLHLSSNGNAPGFPSAGINPSSNAVLDISGQGASIGNVNIATGEDADIIFQRGNDNNQNANITIDQFGEDTLDIQHIYAEGGVTVQTGNVELGNVNIGDIWAYQDGQLDSGYGTYVKVGGDLNQNININDVNTNGFMELTFGGASFGSTTLGSTTNYADYMDVNVNTDTNYNINIDHIYAENGVQIEVGDITVGTVTRGYIHADANTSDDIYSYTAVEIYQEIDTGLDVNDVNSNANVSIAASNLIASDVTTDSVDIYDSLYGQNSGYGYGNGDTLFSRNEDYNLNAYLELDINDINAYGNDNNNNNNGNGNIDITGVNVTLGDLSIGDLTYYYSNIPFDGNYFMISDYNYNIDVNVDINDLNANGDININVAEFSRGDVTIHDLIVQNQVDSNDSDSYLNLFLDVDTNLNSNINIENMTSYSDIHMTVGGIDVGDVTLDGAVQSSAGSAKLDINENYNQNINIHDIDANGDTHIEIRGYTFGTLDMGYTQGEDAAIAHNSSQAYNQSQIHMDRNVNINIDINALWADGNINVDIGDITVGDVLAGGVWSNDNNGNNFIDIDDNIDFNIDIYDFNSNQNINITTGDLIVGSRIARYDDANINSNVDVDINISDINANGSIDITTGRLLNTNLTNVLAGDSNTNLTIGIRDIHAAEGLDITVNASTDLNIDLNYGGGVGSDTNIHVWNGADTLIIVGNEEDNIVVESNYWNRIQGISGNDDVGVEVSYATTDITTNGDWTASSATYNKNSNTENLYAKDDNNDTTVTTTNGWDVDLRNATTSGGIDTYYGFGINIAGDTSNSVIWGSNLADRIEDGTGNNIMHGYGGNDIINAGAGNDTLDGGSGIDTMTGGDGNDTYYVDSTSDVIVEGNGISSGTNDTVFSRVTYDLSTYANNVENLTLTGANDSTNDTVNINGTGNSGANIITGNNGNNILSGLAGNDTIYGGNGNDTIDGGDDNDTLYGGLGNDTFTGGSGSEIFNIDGGVDSITDITNDDTVKVEANGNLNVGTVTTDWTATASSYNLGAAELSSNGNDVDLDLVTGTKGWTVRNTGGAAIFTGSDFNDSLYGGTGDDTLNGGDGSDYISGGNGNDVINGGSNDDTILGGIGDDQIDGGSGNDTLTGGTGADTFTVGSGTNETITDLGLGQDEINVTNSGVSVFATAAGNWTATDASNNKGNVYISSAGFNIDLSADTADADSTRGYSVTATTASAISFTGSSRADNLTGNSGGDILNGGDGGDTLSGLGDDDYINGGAGADTIIGGAGVDALTGGADVDTFSFSTVDIDTSLAGFTDVITDFTATDGERIGGWGVAGSNTNYLENATSVGSLATLLTNADAALNGTVKYYVGITGGDAYLVYDNDGFGYTDVIKLSGVTDLNAIDQFSIVA